MATPLNPSRSAFPFLFLLLLNSALAATTTNPDLPPLINFKAASDPTNRLSDWNPSAADPCNFTGVTCLKNRVTRLVLENLNLTSSHSHLHPLASLTHLRVLSLKSNSLSGPIPNSLSNLTSLKLLFLSHNKFSGQFPLSLLSLSRLYRLDLAHNNLSGAIPGGPTALSRLTHLLTLRLEDNNFTGSISSLILPPSLHDFNVSGNRLSGGIPKSMSSFPASAFSGNAALCGEPLVQACKAGSLDPTMPGSGGAGGGAISSPGNSSSSNKPTQVVTSSPSSLPTAAAKEAGKPTTTRTAASKIGPGWVIAIILGDVAVLALVSLILYCCFWRNYAAKIKLRKGGGGPAGKLSATTAETEKIVYSSTPYPNPNPNPNQTGAGGGARMMMVFFEGAKRFELEDLLRASAEMLGKGAFGTAYKAVLDDGNVVAVKRLKDANLGGGGSGNKFEQQMEVLGRLRHPNLVSLRAYYFAREEKLLVYDYMANGSLFWLLHGNRGPGRTPLDWTTRLKIAAGAARGLAFIHSSCKALKLTHGNIKSTNVLLDRSGNARVSDFGLSTFASSSSSSAAGPRTNGYRAPESGPDPRKLTQKSDVYSFGVLLLELLTGKCPSMADCGMGVGGYGGGGGGVVDLPRWVQSVVREEWTAEVFDLELMRYKDIEEEMVGLLQIAMTCTSPAADQRPKMSQVVKMIEELRGAEVSPAHESVDSVSDSPSMSEDTTCDATSQ